MKNYYFILGLNIYANESEIKQAYRRLALQFHPDKNPSIEAESIFKEINDLKNDPENKEKIEQARMTHIDQWTPIQVIENPATAGPTTEPICQTELLQVAAFG